MGRAQLVEPAQDIELPFVEGRELEAFGPALAQKREIVAANKIDLSVDDDALEKLRRDLPAVEIFPISGVSRAGAYQLSAWDSTLSPQARSTRR